MTDKRFGGLNRMFEFFLNMRDPFVSRFICSKVVQVVRKCFKRFVVRFPYLRRLGSHQRARGNNWSCPVSWMNMGIGVNV